MDGIERIIYFFQGEMTEPQQYGWYHMMWLVFVILGIVILYERKKYYSEKQLKLVIGIYGVVAFVFEILKQISWSFNYDMVTKTVLWDYEWYAFPFQLCTTPIYVLLLFLFLKKSKIRDYLLSYMAYVTIIGSLVTMIMPDNCLTTDVLANIHTMWLHFGSFVVSVYLLMTRTVKIKFENLLHALVVFLVFLGIANSMNIIMYNLGVLNGESFNMFYVSPYFISELPIFNIIQEHVPYIIYLLIYMLAIAIGAIIIYEISYYFQKISCKSNERSYKK